MKVEIHYEIRDEINGYEDMFVVEADDIETIREMVKAETDKRGLDEENNNLYSKVIEE